MDTTNSPIMQNSGPGFVAQWNFMGENVKFSGETPYDAIEWPWKMSRVLW